MSSLRTSPAKTSTLRAQLQALAREIDENLQQARHPTRDPERARQFLLQQEKRVDNVEQALLQATEQILAPEEHNESTGKHQDRNDMTKMTTLELANWFRSVHKQQRMQMARIERALGWKSSQDAKPLSSKLDRTSPSWRIFATAEKLEPVVETDNETDGSYATPGGELSPFFASSLTPTELKVSAHTALLRKRQHVKEAVVSERLHALIEASSPGNDELVKDPVEENECSPGVAQVGQDQVHSSPPTTHEDDCVADEQPVMQSTLDERNESPSKLVVVNNGLDDDEVDEDDANDDDTDSNDDVSAVTGPTVVAPRQHGRRTRLVFNGNRGAHLQTGDDRNDEETCDDDDDSAAYCPTVVARDLGARARLNATKTPIRVGSPYGRPSHIEIDTAVPSPAPTNLTMDSTMLNETFEKFETVKNLSKTCVLDRYRLDLDDSSPTGFKVVPNTSPIKQTSASTPPLNHGSSSTRFTSNRRVFRKTPNPRKKGISALTIDENRPLQDELTVVSSNGSPSTMESPPKHTTNATIESTAQSISPEIPRAGRDLPMKTSEAAIMTSPSDPNSNTFENRGAFLVRSVSFDEYNAAPRVVKMQLSYSEVRSAVETLNSGQSSSSQMTQDEVHKLLEPLGMSERKAKSVVMSLCHFRRLVMNRQAQGNVFLIN